MSRYIRVWQVGVVGLFILVGSMTIRWVATQTSKPPPVAKEGQSSRRGAPQKEAFGVVKELFFPVGGEDRHVSIRAKRSSMVVDDNGRIEEFFDEGEVAIDNPHCTLSLPSFSVDYTVQKLEAPEASFLITMASGSLQGTGKRLTIALDGDVLVCAVAFLRGKVEKEGETLHIESDYGCLRTKNGEGTLDVDRMHATILTKEGEPIELSSKEAQIEWNRENFLATLDGAVEANLLKATLSCDRLYIEPLQKKIFFPYGLTMASKEGKEDRWTLVSPGLSSYSLPEGPLVCEKGASNKQVHILGNGKELTSDRATLTFIKEKGWMPRQLIVEGDVHLYSEEKGALSTFSAQGERGSFDFSSEELTLESDPPAAVLVEEPSRGLLLSTRKIVARKGENGVYGFQGDGLVTVKIKEEEMTLIKKMFPRDAREKK